VKLLRWIALALGALLSAGIIAWLGARFHDGPLGPVPGGPMDGVIVTDAAVDWSFATDLQTLALQTSNPPRSRSVWLVVHEGALYVPAGSSVAEQWPHELAGDPVVLLRIEERLYLRRAVRVGDPALRTLLWERVASKYGVVAPGDREPQWIFRMEPFDPHG